MSEWDFFTQANRAVDNASMKQMTDVLYSLFASCLTSGFTEKQALNIVGATIASSIAASRKGGKS